MSHLNLTNVIESPVISEKGMNSGWVVFKVKKAATKQHVKRSVEYLFSVQVDSVNILNVKGKTKRFGKYFGTRSDWKKAYVKLKPGFSIDFSVT